ncbi:hypothetical protein [Actinoplanes aureus]|uniref:Uncharacterized protein n=1 Tax=Actinoplanes aureus TaxID=2792083 RepID=A0A931CD06_9ACTN|nr:hypothetical protein [Actinoplanes aureus]MBG0567834.1 hypothetical protein [Actinoplanes aureus]
MGSQAYGQLCQFLPALLNPLFGRAVGVMNEAVDALGETSLHLRKAASDITATDAASARVLDAAARPGLDLPEAHLLDLYGDNIVTRFDSNPRMAEHGSGLPTAIRIRPTSTCCGTSDSRPSTWRQRGTESVISGGIDVLVDYGRRRR